MVQMPVKRDLINHTENLVNMHIAASFTNQHSWKMNSFFLSNARFHLTKAVRYFSFARYKIMIIIQEIVLIYYRGKGTIVKSYIQKSSTKVPTYLECELLIDPMHRRGAILYAIIFCNNIIEDVKWHMLVFCQLERYCATAMLTTLP